MVPDEVEHSFACESYHHSPQQQGFGLVRPTWLCKVTLQHLLVLFVIHICFSDPVFLGLLLKSAYPLSSFPLSFVSCEEDTFEMQPCYSPLPQLWLYMKLITKQPPKRPFWWQNNDSFQSSAKTHDEACSVSGNNLKT